MMQRVKYLLVNSMVAAALVSGAAFAANDPSIKGDIRSNIQSAMSEMIERNTVNSVYHVYDPIEGQLHQLTLVKLHDGIVKKGDYYVSCADFKSAKGKMLDLDFLVVQKGDGFVATQAVIHKTDGKKRKYHLED
ncbi:MAG: hypothetical protein KZQ99_11510 [Candidatus Thiodiazotropha sp. (ex Dulcina madagascariensis)]|nr:hypothetical protein [Candidatus Thiodiazotropha sp. (ex Dulcina madagascariensis)]